MSKLQFLFIGLFLFLYAAALGQNKSCSLCGMGVNNPKFIAYATDGEGKSYTFDAIECAINYQKDNNMQFVSISATNYNSKQKINAKTAYYLKSKKLPSPMGAYISAYATKKEAEAMQKKKGGVVLDWVALENSFKDSRFGNVKTGNFSAHNEANFWLRAKYVSLSIGIDPEEVNIRKELIFVD